MLSAGDVLERISSGFYRTSSDTQTMHRDFCQVLDLAIDCVETPEAPSTVAPDSCPDLWSFDQCLTAVEYNTTMPQLCPISRMQGNANSSDDYSIMHCNSSNGLWDTLQECSLSSNQPEVITELPDINQTMLIPDYEVVDEIDNWEKVQMAGYRRYEVVGKCVTVGHALSLASLTVAIVLLFFLKRLHCTRIYIHMNLMIAFMLRGIVWLLHTTAFADSSSVDEEMSTATVQIGLNVFKQYAHDNLSQLLTWKQELCDPYDKTSYYIRCRIYFVMLNYSVTANYYWLLVEGLYLGLLLLRAMNPSSNNRIIMRSFLLLGWVFPWVSVIGGVVTRVLKPDKQNDACWFENEVGPDWWIINIPILISLLINFIIFILVVKVVGSKLKSNVRLTDEQQEHYKWRLTKSTLALIPLLGIQYLITVFFEFFRPENPTLIFVEKAFELLSTSIQGFMVAFIYCFMNGEIQDEVKRCWRAWKIECELKVTNKRRKQPFSNTSLTTLYTGFSRKPSAISTTSTKRSDSVFTLGRHNGDRSPGPSKQFLALSEIAEHSPTQARQSTRLSNSTETSSVINNNHMQLNGVQEKDCRLSVPRWEMRGRHSSTTDDDCFLNSNHMDNETFFCDPESQNLLPKPESQHLHKYVEYKTSVI